MWQSSSRRSSLRTLPGIFDFVWLGFVFQKPQTSSASSVCSRGLAKRGGAEGWGSAKALSALQRLLRGDPGLSQSPGTRQTPGTAIPAPGDTEPSAPGRACAVHENTEPLLLLKAPARGAARPKSAPAARPCFQEQNFHILQVKVGSEKLPAVTGNPGKSPKSSWPLDPLPRG